MTAIRTIISFAALFTLAFTAVFAVGLCLMDRWAGDEDRGEDLEVGR